MTQSGTHWIGGKALPRLPSWLRLSLAPDATASFAGKRH
jgi:hypothetical protein